MVRYNFSDYILFPYSISWRNPSTPHVKSHVFDSGFNRCIFRFGVNGDPTINIDVEAQQLLFPHQSGLSLCNLIQYGIKVDGIRVLYLALHVSVQTVNKESQSVVGPFFDDKSWAPAFKVRRGRNLQPVTDIALQFVKHWINSVSEMGRGGN